MQVTLPAAAETSGIDADGLAREIARLKYTDADNAQRFCLRYGDVFCNANGVGWLHFDGRRWRAQFAREKAFEAAKVVARKLHDERERGDLSGKASERWSTYSQSARGLDAMLKCARTSLLKDMSELDRDPLAIGASNGVVKFTKDEGGAWSAKLEPSSPNDFITRSTSASFNASAKAPRWLQHLSQVQPDKETRAYLKRLFGYCVLGSTEEQAMYFFHGNGRDGKSTTVNVVANVLGDYARPLGSSFLTQLQRIQSADAASPALAALSGDIRFAYSSEPPANGRLDEALVKHITGGAKLSARRPYGDTFEFKPRFKIILECNRLPKFTGTDDGIRRRLVVVPWRHQIPETAIDRKIEETLCQEERGGILAWLVEGAVEYLNIGLQPSPIVEAATAAYRGQVSHREAATPEPAERVFQSWLAARIERYREHRADQKALWDSYREYCGAEEAASVRRGQFVDMLTRSGFVRCERLDGKRRRVMWAGGRPAAGAECAGEGRRNCFAT